MAQWLSWLERRPVTAKVESSSLFWVVQDVDHLDKCRSGGTGRRPGLKIPWVVIPVPVRFRSPALLITLISYVRLAQLDRAFGYGPKGRGFESSNAR